MQAQMSASANGDKSGMEEMLAKLYSSTNTSKPRKSRKRESALPPLPINTSLHEEPGNVASAMLRDLQDDPEVGASTSPPATPQAYQSTRRSRRMTGSDQNSLPSTPREPRTPRNEIVEEADEEMEES